MLGNLKKLMNKYKHILDRYPFIRVRNEDYDFFVTQEFGISQITLETERESILNEIKNEVEKKGLSLYIHFPFCPGVCDFCHYFVLEYKEIKKYQNYTDYLIKEIELLLKKVRKIKGKTISSLYFGGGTPGLMKKGEIEKIFSFLCQNFKINSSCEATIETSPEIISKEKINLWKRYFNRISVGIQTLNPKLLAIIGRFGKKRECEFNENNIIDKLKLLSNCFNGTINVDLIYGMPSQTFNDIKNDIDKILKAIPDSQKFSFTLYRLRLRRGNNFSKLYYQYKEGEITFPSQEEIYAIKYKIAEYLSLREKGFTEGPAGWFLRGITNFKTYENRWEKSIPLIGIGPSAYSYVGKYEWYNFRNLEHYKKSIDNGILPWDKACVLKETTRIFRKFKYSLTLTEEEVNKLKEKSKRIEGLFNSEIFSFDKRTLKYELTEFGKPMIEEIVNGINSVLLNLYELRIEVKKINLETNEEIIRENLRKIFSCFCRVLNIDWATFSTILPGRVFHINYNEKNPQQEKEFYKYFNNPQNFSLSTFLFSKENGQLIKTYLKEETIFYIKYLKNKVTVTPLSSRLSQPLQFPKSGFNNDDKKKYNVYKNKMETLTGLQGNLKGIYFITLRGVEVYGEGYQVNGLYLPCSSHQIKDLSERVCEIQEDLIYVFSELYIYRFLKSMYFHALRSAVAAIMARNMSHNIGSHILVYLKMEKIIDLFSRIVIKEKKNISKFQEFFSKIEEIQSELTELTKNKEYKIETLMSKLSNLERELKDLNSQDIRWGILEWIEDTKTFFGYLQHRMDFLAQISTEWPQWTFSAYLMKDIMRNFLMQRHLLDGIAKSEGLRGFYYEWEKPYQNYFQNYLNIKDKLLKIKKESEERFKKIKIHITSPSKWGENSPTELINYKEETFKVNIEKDIAIAIPGGIVGYHAFYVILENIIRNCAKHTFAKMKEKKDLEIWINFEDDAKEPSSYWRVKIYDNLSRIKKKIDDKKFFRIFPPNEKEKTPEKDLVAFMNECLRHSLIKETGEVDKRHWGMAEMKIAAGYLQMRNIQDIGAEGDKITGSENDHHGRQEDFIIRAVESPLRTLGFEFKVKKTKEVGIVCYGGNK